MAARREHPVARFHAGGARADGFHHARCVETRNERAFGLVLVAALDHQQVGEVEPHGAGLDHDLAGAGLRVGQILDPMRLERRELLDHECAHQAVSR